MENIINFFYSEFKSKILFTDEKEKKKEGRYCVGISTGGKQVASAPKPLVRIIPNRDQLSPATVVGRHGCQQGNIEGEVCSNRTGIPQCIAPDLSQS